MSSFKNNLPQSWVHTTLGEIYNVVGGGTPATQNPEYWNGDIPWITSADIEDVRQINIRKYVTEKGIDESATNKVPARTLLVATRVGLGKIAISNTPICFSQDLQGLVQNSVLIYPEYTLYLLSYELQILKFDARGTTISGITKKQLKDLGFPLPPFNEQKRIVAKIEELFTELDAGIASLHTAQAQLKTYRQSLLKHAFEGHLTAAWRTAHADQLEPAATLLQRIQAERQARYQAELQAWEKGGKDGKRKPSPPKDLPPLTDLDTLPQLPPTWTWVKVGNISDVGTGVTPLKSRTDFYTDGKIPWVTSGALNEMFVTEASDFVTETALRETNLRLYPKHSLLIALYGEGKTRGKCSELLIDATTNQAIAVIIQEGTSAKIRKYMKWFFQKNYGDIRLKSSGGVQPNLNLGIIMNTVFPMCSIQESEYLVELVEEKLSVVDQLEQIITTALQQAEALRQSILKKAFAGQLVPQDPHDEPAAQLLARIQAQQNIRKNEGQTQ